MFGFIRETIDFEDRASRAQTLARDPAFKTDLETLHITLETLLKDAEHLRSDSLGNDESAVGTALTSATNDCHPTI